MYSTLRHALAAGCLAAGFGVITILGQGTSTGDAHRAAAKAAAGQDHLALLNTLCPAPREAPATPAARGTGRGAAAGANRGGAAPARGQTAGAPAAQRTGPPREQWHVEPVKVFDNLYFVGQSEYSAWAVNTSDGIIVIDTIFDYSVEDEVVGGLRKLGLDPAKIKYVIVSHGHGDHSGGAKYLQDTFGSRILLSAADWDLLDRSNGTKPKRDMIVTDGQKLTLGDTTLTMYLTPGHTPGTISTIIPVKDNGRTHVLAYPGGTAFNFTITPDKPRTFWFTTYSASVERFRDAAMKAGAEGLITNHTNYDGSKVKMPKLAARKPGDPHPYLIGKDAVARYMTVQSECAKAGLADLSAQAPQ
jgi:metallo-beta-lactamase class B